MHRLIGVLGIVGAVLVVPWVGASTLVSSACQADQPPRFLFGFAALRDRLGATMGEPVECEHMDSETGDSLQRTTTGIAYQRKGSNMPTFTNGQESWALTSSGVAYWMGEPSWTVGVAPSGPEVMSSDELDAQLPPSPATYPSLDAVTIVQKLDSTGDRLIVRRGGSLYQIEKNEGCLDTSLDVGKLVLILSHGPSAQAGSELILPGGNGRCSVRSSREL